VRRFITSLPGKVIGQLVIVALILPSITLALYSRASAQIATLPSWAITEFVNKKSPGTTYGKAAATAIGNELAKTGAFDVVPSDTVDRAIESLTISSPPDGLVNMLRLGQEVHATSIVSGEIVDYRVQPAGSGKQASVVMKVLVYDVASGLPVNGAAIRGFSTIRAGSIADDTLIKDAIAQASSEAIHEIQAHQLPVGTVLNTQQNKALINKGARAGFANGQEVIVLRNHEQVATAKVTDVEPDSSYIVASNIVRGIQPGDRVRVVFKVADIVVDPGGNPHIRPVKDTSFPSGLLSVALIVGLIAALVGGGNGGSQDTVSNVAASAALYPNEAGVPAVYVTWSPNAFAGGNSQRANWQIYRSDVTDSPIGTTNGNGLAQEYTDQVGTGTAANALNFATFIANQLGYNQVCNYSTYYDSTNTTAIPSIVVGQQYIYQVQEVYDLLSIDLPNGGTSQTSGGTAEGSTATGTTTTASGTTTTATGTGTGTGTGTTTGTTGVTTGTSSSATGTTTTASGTTTTSTTGTGGQLCYFLSSKVTAIGLATPLNAPSLVAPANGASLNGQQASDFTVNSAEGAQPGLAILYVLEFSSTIGFQKGTYFTVASFQSNQSGVVGTPGAGVNPATYFPNATSTTPIYWRYGVRNMADNPGPAPDFLTRERYIFCPPRSFTFTGTPPPPPKRQRIGGKGKAG